MTERTPGMQHEEDCGEDVNAMHYLPVLRQLRGLRKLLRHDPAKEDASLERFQRHIHKLHEGEGVPLTDE